MASVLRIIRTEDTAAVERVLSGVGDRSRTVERERWPGSSRTCGSAATGRCSITPAGSTVSGPVEVSVAEMREAARTVPTAVRGAIRFAARNIRTVARKQVPRGWRVKTAPGVTVEQRVTPLDRVGCYVPAGRYPLPSSLLMTAIPAAVAGVGEVVVVCPRPDATVMFAALEAGVDRMFRIGGAHAIAALAYGTATVPRVDRIVGPGSAYVAAAKALVSRDCAIDFFAGPSEIVVVSARGRPAWIAADLIAQAEHDVDARAILITPSRRLAAAVAREVDRQVPADGPASEALRAQRRHHRHADDERSDCVVPARCPRARGVRRRAKRRRN